MLSQLWAKTGFSSMPWLLKDYLDHAALPHFFAPFLLRRRGTALLGVWALPGHFVRVVAPASEAESYLQPAKYRLVYSTKQTTQKQILGPEPCISVADVEAPTPQTEVRVTGDSAKGAVR